MKTELTIENIRPYVRYAKILNMGPDYYARDRRSYDNRLVYFFEGTGELIINGTSHTGVRGSLFLWSPDDVYTLRATGDGFKAIIINFDYTYGSKQSNLAIPPADDFRFDETQRTEDVCFSDIKEFNKPLALQDMRSMESILLSIDMEFINPRINYNLMLSAMMTVALLRISRASRGGYGEEMPPLVADVTAYIHENYAGDLSNSTIGSVFNYHPNYVNRAMLASTGQSLHQYVIGVRAMKALELIQTTDLTITDIASAAGFRSIKHFSQCFKKVYGFAPSYFRGQNNDLKKG